MPKVPKYSNIIKKGDKWFRGIVIVPNPYKNVKYKGYEAWIEVRDVSSSSEESSIIWSDLKQSWMDSIDTWEEEKKNPPPKNTNNQGQTNNIDTSTPSKPETLNLPKGDFEKLVDKVKEIQNDVKKTIPEKAKDMKKLMEEIEKKNEERTKKLRVAEDKLSEERIEFAARIKQAEEQGNENIKRAFAAKMQEADIKIAENLAKQSEVPTKNHYLKMLEELEKDKQKSFLEKVNWKNPWTYGMIGIFFVIIFLGLWIWGRIKSTFNK